MPTPIDTALGANARRVRDSISTTVRNVLRSTNVGDQGGNQNIIGTGRGSIATLNFPLREVDGDSPTGTFTLTTADIADITRFERAALISADPNRAAPTEAQVQERVSNFIDRVMERGAAERAAGSDAASRGDLNVIFAEEYNRLRTEYVSGNPEVVPEAGVRAERPAGPTNGTRSRVPAAERFPDSMVPALPVPEPGAARPARPARRPAARTELDNSIEGALAGLRNVGTEVLNMGSSTVTAAVTGSSRTRDDGGVGGPGSA